MALSRRYFKQQYFYLLNEHGKLFHLYDPISFVKNPSKVPSGPTFLRNEKFLDFFFGDNIARTPPELPHAKLFPFVSRCGNEGNFVAVPGVSAPAVFTAYDSDERVFTFAGSLKQPLDAERLREFDGRLYHPLDLCRGLRRPVRVRRKFRDSSVGVDDGDDDEVASSTAAAAAPKSECCDPLEMEVALRTYNNNNKSYNGGEEETAKEKALQDSLSQMGLVSSSVAFEIGFNFMSEDEEQNGVVDSEQAPRYTISFDNGVTNVSVKPLL